MFRGACRPIPHNSATSEGATAGMLDGKTIYFDSTSPQTAASSEGAALRKQPSFKWAQYVRPGRSPTRATGDVPQQSPKGSPQSLEHEILASSFQIVNERIAEAALDYGVEGWSRWNWERRSTAGANKVWYSSSFSCSDWYTTAKSIEDAC